MRRLGEDPITTASDASNPNPNPNRLAAASKDWLVRWAYAWLEVDVAPVARPGAGGATLRRSTHACVGKPDRTDKKKEVIIKVKVEGKKERRKK
jgi:hypothetical protein